MDQLDLDSDIDKNNLDSNNKLSGIDKETLKIMSLRWNKEAENNLREKYGKESHSTIQKQQRTAKVLEQKNAHTSHIGALFHCQLEMKFNSSSSQRLAEFFFSEPVNFITPVCSLSQLPQGNIIFKSKIQLHKKQCFQALKKILPDCLN